MRSKAIEVSERPVPQDSIVNDQPIWNIHSASGDQLGAAASFQQAWGAVVQNEMVPLYVN